MNSDLIPALEELFQKINVQHFEGLLETPDLSWNSRLRSSAGRFLPGYQRIGLRFDPRIEIASYLLEEQNALDLVVDTLAHEMIHYWLWYRKRPYGHTGEFLRKMRQMGVSRYNPVPRLQKPKYLYMCPSCEHEYPSRKVLRNRACGPCCRSHSQGRFDERFKLRLTSREVD